MNGNQPYPDNSFSADVPQKRLWLEKSGLLNIRTGLLLLILLGSWLVVSYFTVSWFINKRLAADLLRHSTALIQSESAVTYHFERSLAFLHAMPTNVADNVAVVTALRSFDPQTVAKMDSPEGKRSFLNSRKDLKALNFHLATQKKLFDVDVIWILADNGDCIASSNYDQVESFVGTNYVDRAYFIKAMSGSRGRQYAVGRKTNIPGLYFSAPIYNGIKVIGAVAVKIDISKLSQWFNRFNCFVTDAAGVIILASDKSLENMALVDAPVFSMTSAAREKQYKQLDFKMLKIGDFGDKFLSYPAITLPGTDKSLYMLARSQQNKDGYTIFTYSKVSEIEQFRTVQAQFTVLIFISGAAPMPQTK